MKKFRITPLSGSTEETIVAAPIKAVAVSNFANDKRLAFRTIKDNPNLFALYANTAVKFEDGVFFPETQYRIEEIG